MTNATAQPDRPATHDGLRATPNKYSINTTGTAARRAEGTRPPKGRYDWGHMRYGYYLTSVGKRRKSKSVTETRRTPRGRYAGDDPVAGRGALRVLALTHKLEMAICSRLGR